MPFDSINLLSTTSNAYSTLLEMYSRNAARSNVDGEVRHDARLIPQSGGGTSLDTEAVNFDWIAESLRNKAGEKYWYNQKVNDAFSGFINQFGTKDGKDTLGHTLNGFVTHFNTLVNSPNINDKYLAIQDFQLFLNKFSQLQQSITIQRQTIVTNEESLVSQATDLIQTIASVNVENRTPDQETLLCKSINELSQIMDINVQFAGSGVTSNIVKIFLANQSQFKIIDGTYVMASLQYNPVTAIDPGEAIGAIQFTNGLTSTDMRPFLSGGMLAGHTAANQKLVNMNSTLDQFALNMMNTLNATHNLGTSGQAAPSTMTGIVGCLGAEGTPLTGGTVISGQGTWRIAMQDATGRLLDYKDVALSPNMTVTSLINAINNAPYILGNGATLTASLTPSGSFQIANNNPQNTLSLGNAGVLTASLCTGAVFNGGDATNASHFFHMNDLISRTSITPADLTDGLFSNLQVSPNIVTNPNSLAGAVLNGSILLVGGDFVVGSNDTANFDALYKSLTQLPVTFGAVGEFSAVTTNLSDYATHFSSFYIQSKQVSDGNTKSALLQYNNAKLDAGAKSGKTTPDQEYQRIVELGQRIDAIRRCLSACMRLDQEALKLLDLR